MKNVEIVFLMTSLDSKASFTTTGEIKGNHIIFDDNEKNRHYVIIKKDIIEYHKKGSMDMKYVFNLIENTYGTYCIDGNKFEFVIKTHVLEIKDNELMIKYDLLMDNEVINKSTLLIKYS